MTREEILRRYRKNRDGGRAEVYRGYNPSDSNAVIVERLTGELFVITSDKGTFVGKRVEVRPGVFKPAMHAILVARPDGSDPRP